MFSDASYLMCNFPIFDVVWDKLHQIQENHVIVDSIARISLKHGILEAGKLEVWPTRARRYWVFYLPLCNLKFHVAC